MERYKDLNTQLKLAKIFRAVISAGLVAPVFVSVSACEKSKPVVEESVVSVATTQAPETTLPPTTETPTTKEEIKKFEGLKIELISDPSLSKLKLQRGNQIFTPKEVVYADPVEGPKKLENALLVTWALTLKEREKHPAFENVDKGNQEALISTLKGLLDKGEIPTFTLQLENDWSIAADKAKTSKTEIYKVDMTKGVKLVFVGEVTNLVEEEGTAVDSRDFIVFLHTPGDFQPAYALRYEVGEDNSLTIKLFEFVPGDFDFCVGIGISLQRIILNETQRIDVANWKPNSIIFDNLFDGNQWDENGKWIENGKPVIVMNGDYSQS